MKLNLVRERLQMHEDVNLFPILDQEVMEKFYQAKLEVWKCRDRLMVVKDYTSEHHLLAWKKDQVTISYLYEELPTKYKNNLYFLLVLDWRAYLSDLILGEITQIEKNYKVCRKYVLRDEVDFRRVPFLQNMDLVDPKQFDYEADFKCKILPKDSSIKVHDVIRNYFTQYQKDHSTRIAYALEILRKEK